MSTQQRKINTKANPENNRYWQLLDWQKQRLFQGVIRINRNPRLKDCWLKINCCRNKDDKTKGNLTVTLCVIVYKRKAFACVM